MARIGVALPLLFAAACAPGDPFAGQTTGLAAGVERRASDGLLDRPELQEVVDLQAARDAGGLRVRLGSPDAAVRARAAFALGSMPGSGAAPELAALLDDPDAGVRADAAFALGQIPQLGGQQPLMLARLASEPDAAVQRLVIEALGKQGGVEALGSLFDVTDALADEATLALARLALRGAQSEGVLDTLAARLTHPDPLVRRNAAWFFDRSDDPLVWMGQRTDVLAALDGYALDEPAARHLLDATGGRLDAFALPRLLRFSNWGADWRVRAEAVAGLRSAGFGDERALALLRAVEDPAPLVRVQSALVIADEPPVGLLMDGAERIVREGGVDPAVEGPLLSFLAKVSRKEPVLARADATPLDDRAAWLGLIAAFLAMPGEEALAPLARAAGASDVLVADAAADALVERWDVAINLSETYAGFRRWLAEARDNAARAGHTDAVALLEWALDSVELGGTGEMPAPGSVAPRAGAGAEDATPDEIVRAAPPADWGYLASLGTGPRLVLETERGRIVAVLDTEAAPLTVQAVARNAAAGLYDGLPFHRVIPDFVAQVGDPSLAQDGRVAPFPGSPGRSELTRLRFGTSREDLRVLGMARTSEFDSEGSQFFLTHSAQMHLDGGYTAFGWVTGGVGVLDRIQPGDLLERVYVVPGAMPD